jgi:DNA helicase-2/ATP-dependent DNA helicase PcrA
MHPIAPRLKMVPDWWRLKCGQSTSADAGPPHLDEDYLVLSTIHSAKGQEWDAIVVLNVTDGCIPSDMAVGSRDETEEECGLL